METIRVGMAQLKVAGNPEILSCTGLGSCIAIVFYDRIYKIGAMAHIMLPSSKCGRACDPPVLNKAKYADTAIDEMLEEMGKLGIKKRSIKAYIFGGANMFPGLFHKEEFINIGQKNIDSVKEELFQREIKITGEDVGGNSGRTVALYIETGKVEMKKTYGEKKIWE